MRSGKDLRRVRRTNPFGNFFCDGAGIMMNGSGMRVYLTLVAVAAASVVATAAPSAGLLGHWKFDDAQGDVAEDSSGNHNDADVWGAQWVRGAFGTALHFGGTDSWVFVPQVADLDGANEMTVEAWVLWESGGRYPNVLTGGTWSPGGFLVFVQDEACSFRLGRPGVSAGSASGGWQEISAPLLNKFQVGKWYHLAATFKRPDLTTYVNGQKVGSAKWDYPVGYSGDLQIGRWAGESCHKGLIDEVKLLNRARSAEAVLADYAAEALRRTAAPAQAAYEVIPESDRRGPAMATLQNEFVRFEVDARGRCLALVDKRTGKDYLAKPTPLASVRIGDKVIRRARASYAGGKLTLEFGNGEAKAVLGLTAKDRYLTFEVLSVEGEAIDELTFLTLQLPTGKYGSPMSGALVFEEFGVCLRALNIDTQVSLRSNPASLRATGCRKYRLLGAKAALVACPTGTLLPVLREMVKAEGVPQSSLGGPWALEAEGTRGSYLFATVSESNVDWWIDEAKRGGFTHIHFGTWEKSLGHYEPNPALFPHGLDGVKAVVSKIHQAGLKVGMHTLTGCIAPNDPWVTPIPDKRLAADAAYALAAAMDDKSDTILTVEEPGVHDVIWSYAGAGNVFRIGDELIHYAAVSHQPPYGFTKCTRGAFGTKPAAHAKGAVADHLLQRYLAFYPDEKSTLVGEVADAIAHVYNECEFDQLYMDGSEGMGNWHAIEIMRDAIYRRLKRPAIVEASAWGHWSWYYHSRVGAWDHSSWAFKQFTDVHCADIPTYRQGGLCQAQLGWWVVLGPSATSRAELPDEMEYFCCKTFAHDAPTSVQGIAAGSKPWNARQDEYLTLSGQYERLRLANYFTEAVKERLRKPGDDFRLHQADSGEWEFLPTSYLKHKVTGLDDGSAVWTATHQHGKQPVKLRLEALWAAQPYDAEDALVLTDFAKPEDFAVHRNASGVSHTFAPSAAQVKVGDVSACFTATNAGASRRGAWAHAGTRFEPNFDMGQCEALGVWVHGDGKGEMLNLQLSNPPEYMQAFAEHYVKVDFEGWRYFELLLRERDAEKYHDYEWPYFAQHGIFRTALSRDHVSELNLYLNNLPPNDTATVYLSALKAVRTAAVSLSNPTLQVNGQRLTIPVTLQSGSYVEMESMEDCRIYDSRCELQQRLALIGDAPVLKPGENSVRFTGRGREGFAVRAEVTLIASGQPLRGKASDKQTNWNMLRDEYELPRTLLTLDGQQNQWDVAARRGAPTLGVEIEVNETGATGEAYDDPAALPLERFDDLGFFADSPDNQFAKFVYDSSYKGVATKPGVTQELTRSTDPVKLGTACARYTATSTLTDNGGWSARGRRFREPLDLSKYQGLGFWLRGDGKGERFKLQLRDKAGGWHDMYTTVSFTGWRYCEFSLAGADKLDAKNVEYMILYYNGLPAKQTVTCYVDEVRALPRVAGLKRPELTVGGQRLVFPVELSTGDRLVYRSLIDCHVYRSAPPGAEALRPEGTELTLKPGRNPVKFTVDPTSPKQFRATVSLVKSYR